MPDEAHELPAVQVLLPVFFAECGHTREAYTIMNDVVEFTIAEILSARLFHIRCLWIKALPDGRVAASIVRVTERAMIGEMFHRLR